MSKIYFVVNDCQDMTKETCKGTDEANAYKTFIEMNKSSIAHLIRVDEESKYANAFDYVNNEWVDKNVRVWFVVCHKPASTGHEPIISQDGIFDTMKEAEEYIREYGGKWSICNFMELRYRMAENFKALHPKTI